MSESEIIGYVIWWPSGREFSEKCPGPECPAKWDALYRIFSATIPVSKYELVGRISPVHIRGADVIDWVSPDAMESGTELYRKVAP